MDKLKLLFVSPEAAPFMSTGGLGDVAGSLPKALAKRKDMDVRIVLPLYQGITDRRGFEFLGSGYVPLSWRNQYCGIFYKKLNGVTYYFIDNEYYFKRTECYGYYDDAERFAFFSKAVLHMLPLIGFIPDIIHSNDWQTALVPVYLSTMFSRDKRFQNIRTVITIHNIEYQGQYDLNIAGDVLDLSGKDVDIVEYAGSVNLLKGALEASNIISTVSESYAREIFDDVYAHGLAPVIRKNASKIRGILNGIDTETYNPQTDAALFRKFSSKSPEGKQVNKVRLQSLMGLPQDKDIPVIAIISRLVAHKGMELIARGIHEILKEKVQLIVLGRGDRHFEFFFKSLQDSYSSSIATRIDFNSDLARKIYAGSDLFLMPSISEPCGTAQMIASRYGSVPIVRETGGLKDSIRDCSLGDGNGFTFSGQDPEALSDAIKRALSVYHNREDWKNLVKTVMNTDFSWDNSALKYFEMYKSLADGGKKS
ncbi:glycogen synthase [Parasporobacterium paucivorans]|uniref:Glycogen synthase n=1 Tax=Parasporobacterium paucivorans DSM 15970 TaxID=1122934 RepID=A0A1M6G6P5_9FIRM|nr:glycogen/starch synthase [Parasporobacterium paucivorans]SHJ05457.1 starch synthase [Parasporobacterium paucivorans DSM 15970]